MRRSALSPRGIEMSWPTIQDARWSSIPAGGVSFRLASIEDLKEASVAKIDYEYEITEERVRAYLKVPEIDRLRWLE